jgi:hypothetical protein
MMGMILLFAPALSGFLFGGIVFIPYLAVYILSIIARYKRLAAKPPRSLFLWGTLNPLPTLSVVWIISWIMVLRA